CMQALKFPLTF
nr:immunoglobulin light chain junction region [Macaca mulatta]